MKELMKPKVSICLPNYNLAPYLPEAIESVLRQSYTNFEFIIIDNCSTDNSRDIIQQYAERDPRIRFSVNDHNVGMVNNLNLCLQHAKGDYIKYLLSDDILDSPIALEKMVAVLDADSDIALVATARNVIDDRSIIRQVLSEYRTSSSYVGTDIIQECLIDQKNKIGEPSVVLFRKKNAGRGFDSRYRQMVDLEMWFHILEQGNFAYIDEPLCSFRSHPNQQTHVNISQRVVSDEAFKLLEGYAKKPYVNLSIFKREYMLYVPVYAVWKQYRKSQISRQEALGKIKERYSIFKFITFYPVFKMCKLLKNIIRPINKVKNNFQL
jgi:glycosyltransferase involved in cell wall biosynthesis